MTSHWLEGGNVCSPRGFRAGAVYTGVKTYGPEPRFDLGLLVSDQPAEVGGVFTQNKIPGAPVKVCRERLLSGQRTSGIVVNSGCSNVGMGQQGIEDAKAMAAQAAARAGVNESAMLVASTGVIGRRLPAPVIEQGIASLELSREGGHDFSRAIMTTDTQSKSRALRFSDGQRTYTLGGAAKGAGMAHPDMATVLCFLTTDACVERDFLQRTLKEAADHSLNMLDVDMDTSTSDTMLVFANGCAGGPLIDAAHASAPAFREALRTLAIEFARDLAKDGEGAKTLIEVTVAGAASLNDARIAARTIVSSPLVKTMVAGRDPNLGRVLMALGRSGAQLEEQRVSVWIGELCAFRQGNVGEASYDAMTHTMNAAEVKIRVELGLGSARATAWGCDLTEEYVRINADYTT